MTAVSLGDIAQVITALAALSALVTSLLNRSKIHQVYLSLNSRLSELLRTTAAASRAEGVEHEREQQKNGNPK